MSTILRWTNPNSVGAPVDAVLVYRSTSTIDPESLPSPLATLAGSAIYYEDTTAVDATIYYYRVAFERGSELSVSGEITITAPTDTNAAVTLPPISGSTGVLLDSSGVCLYNNSSTDKVLGEWKSVRKILAAMVVWEEKQAVWDSELVTVTSADIDPVAPEWQSDLEDGDQLTWEGIVQLMLVPSKSDVAATVTRVLGAELMAKYGTGDNAQRAIGYWMGVAAVRCGVPNSVAFTNTAGTVSDELLNDTMIASPRSIALMLRQTLQNTVLADIMASKQVTVDVSGPDPRTVSFRSMDRMQDVWNASDTPTDSTVAGYVGGKTGDAGSGSQTYSITAPSGEVLYGVVKGATDEKARAHDIRRIVMASENDFARLRSAETAPDPDAADVKLKIESAFPPVDEGPVGMTVTNTGVTQVASSYMDGDALVFNGSSYLTMSGTAPVLGSSDFTIELFLYGNGATYGSTIADVFGQYRAISGGRSWAFQISSTAVTFFYSSNGTAFASVAFTIGRTFLLNGAPTHICAQRSGADLVLFINGIPTAVHNIGATAIHSPGATSVMLGARQSAGGSAENFYAGMIQEATVTVGAARYSQAGFRPRYRPARWD